MIQINNSLFHDHSIFSSCLINTRENLIKCNLIKYEISNILVAICWNIGYLRLLLSSYGKFKFVYYQMFISGSFHIRSWNPFKFKYVIFDIFFPRYYIKILSDEYIKRKRLHVEQQEIKAISYFIIPEKRVTYLEYVYVIINV